MADITTEELEKIEKEYHSTTGIKKIKDFVSPEEIYEELIQSIRKYHPSADISLVEKAYHVADEAHKGQVRKSGEAYIIHPLCVSIILADLEMDKETIAAGLLHDVVEDTIYTSEEIEAMSKGLLFWRSFTHWIGGMGVLVFLVALLPLSGGSNVHLLRAESTGPSVSKLVPKVRSSAKILYFIYIGITLCEIVFLLFGGMSLFEALTLSFGTAGTGGFGIVNSSVADYSPFVQNTITVFMILFGIDFTVYYLILTRRWRDALKSDEYKVYLSVILVSALLISVNCRYLFPDFATSLRHGFFQTASIITTTGYSTANFDLWPSLSKGILIILMFIGGCHDNSPATEPYCYSFIPVWILKALIVDRSLFGLIPSYFDVMNNNHDFWKIDLTTSTTTKFTQYQDERMHMWRVIGIRYTSSVSPQAV